LKISLKLSPILVKRISSTPTSILNCLGLLFSMFLGTSLTFHSPSSLSTSYKESQSQLVAKSDKVPRKLSLLLSFELLALSLLSKEPKTHFLSLIYYVLILLCFYLKLSLSLKTILPYLYIFIFIINLHNFLFLFYLFYIYLS
jgi:hypothetical protein